MVLLLAGFFAARLFVDLFFGAAFFIRFAMAPLR